MTEALRRHWPEYLMEAWGLGTFMLSACLFSVLLWHPGSPVAQVVPDGLGRRALMGLAMGGTALGIFYSPWGRQSGAHINPAVTLTFLRLGKVPVQDAAFYIAAQFLGGTAGVLLSRLLVGDALAHPAVRYAVTLPGPAGPGLAFAAELAIAFGMMTTVLTASSQPRAERFTGALAASLVLLYITFESPLSGMSINPARTFASALPAGDWTSAWVYFTAPLAGMLLAAEGFQALSQARRQHCAKLVHSGAARCIFCGPDRLRAAAKAPTAA